MAATLSRLYRKPSSPWSEPASIKQTDWRDGISSLDFQEQIGEVVPEHKPGHQDPLGCRSASGGGGGMDAGQRSRVRGQRTVPGHGAVERRDRDLRKSRGCDWRFLSV